MRWIHILVFTTSIENVSRSIEIDRLSPFFKRFSLSARVFFSGQLCGTSSDHVTKTAGHLHILRRGVLKVSQADGPPLVIAEPTILVYPRPEQHTFQSDGADLLCAFVEFGAGMLNPLTSALPRVLMVPLSAAPELEPTVELLFAEAFDRKDGRQAAVDHLAEYFLILLLRFAIDTKLMHGGVLTALSDAHLSRVLHALHEEPERDWSLEELARVAGMSRARFAAHFLATVGQTPFEYLTMWRMGVAQSLLRKGEPLKMVAPSVGFATTGAFTRCFSRHIGMSPKAWLESQESGEISRA